MLRSLLYFIKLVSYWLLFFTLYRIIFLLVYPSKTPVGKFYESLKIFYYSLRLDFATIAYLITIPLILWAFQQFMKSNLLNRINHFYNLFMISVITLLCISNIAMYGEWNSLISFNTLYYLVSPAKVFPYMTTLELIGVCLGVAVIISVFVLLFRVLILMVIPYSTGKILYKIIILPVIFPVVFFTMRGGLQQMPINESFSCFSQVLFFDNVSINPAWHLGRMTVIAMDKQDEPPTEKK